MLNLRPARNARNALLPTTLATAHPHVAARLSQVKGAQVRQRELQRRVVILHERGKAPRAGAHLQRLHRGRVLAGHVVGQRQQRGALHGCGEGGREGGEACGGKHRVGLGSRSAGWRGPAGRASRTAALSQAAHRPGGPRRASRWTSRSFGLQGAKIRKQLRAVSGAVGGRALSDGRRPCTAASRADTKQAPSRAPEPPRPAQSRTAPGAHPAVGLVVEALHEVVGQEGGLEPVRLRHSRVAAGRQAADGTARDQSEWPWRSPATACDAKHPHGRRPRKGAHRRRSVAVASDTKEVALRST